MTFDRYFWTAPREQFTGFIRGFGSTAIAYVILAIYATSGFVLYTLVWRPMFQSADAIPHRVASFFFQIWLSTTALSLAFVVAEFVRSKIIERSLDKQAVEIGQELYVIETVLNEQLANLSNENKNYSVQSPSDPPYSHDDEFP